MVSTALVMLRRVFQWRGAGSGPGDDTGRNGDRVGRRNKAASSGDGGPK